jgi:hypothetical protein
MPSPAVIDYASPVPRSRLRLAGRSEIRWVSGPGRVVVTQVLAGREGVIAALLLAGLSIVLVSFSIVNMPGRLQRNAGSIGIMVVLMAAEVIVGARVIHNTWRKTILTVTREALTVETAAPFAMRQQSFGFRSEQVADIAVVDCEPMPGEEVVPELEIRLWSIPPVRLFTGHPRQTLIPIARAIVQVQPIKPPPQAVTTPETETPPETRAATALATLVTPVTPAQADTGFTVNR